MNNKLGCKYIVKYYATAILPVTNCKKFV